MATVSEALSGLKARMQALPAYGKTPAAIYVHPAETGNLKKITVFPTIVIGEYLGDERNWTLASFGVGRDQWQAGINVYLGPEAVQGLGHKDAAVIGLHDGWPKAIASAILGGYTLGGKADLIGAGGDLRMDYVIGGVFWNKELYWGIHWLVPIWQEHAQALTP